MWKYEYLPTELNTTDEPYAKVTLRDFQILDWETKENEYQFRTIHVLGEYQVNWAQVPLVGHSGEYIIAPQDVVAYELFNQPAEVPENA